MRRIYKKITIILLLFLMTFSIVNANELSNSDISIFVDDVKQVYDTKPIIENGRTLVPMRGIFETLGAKVDWEEETKTAKATKEEMQVEIKIGSYFAKKGNESIKLSVQPMIIEGRTMVPLRFIGESFGAKVDWNGEKRIVTIATQKTSEKEEIKKETKEESTTADNNSVLTYEKGIEMALKHSYTLKNQNENIERADELRDNVSDSLGSVRGSGYGNGSDSSINSVTQNLKGLDISLEIAKKVADITKEGIEFQVENSMDTINRLNDEENLTNLKLEYAKIMKNISQIKADQGLESEFNLENARQSHEQEEKQKDVLLKSIDSAYITLNQLLGSSENDRYMVEEDLVWEPVEAKDADTIASRAIDTDPYVWMQEKEIENKELGIKLYTFNAGQDPYKVKEIDLRKAKNDLANIKQKLDETMRLRFNQIKQLEENYNVLLLNLDKAERGLKVVQSQYDVGMAIEAQLKEAELSVATVKHEIKKVMIDHKKLKKLLEKQYLLADYK